MLKCCFEGAFIASLIVFLTSDDGSKVEFIGLMMTVQLAAVLTAPLLVSLFHLGLSQLKKYAERLKTYSLMNMFVNKMFP